MLREPADGGDGHAAHNLAMALKSPPPGTGYEPDRTAHLHYMGIATQSGFEASVASDPNWWRPKEGEA